MTNDELGRKIEFLIEQQAQLTADVQKLSEDAKLLIVDIKQLTDANVTTMKGISTLLAFEGEDREWMRKTGGTVDGLEIRVARLETAMAQIGEAHRALTEAQKRTEDHLNALTVLVERWMSGNGKSRQS